MKKARVYVTLKGGVLDPQGQAVGRTLARMGYEEVSDVRIGKYVELEVADGTTSERLEEMCRKLIANTVIENYRVELDASVPAAAAEPAKKKKK
ncbi:MAG TPA: phosphoribosylformylglycinamidine synthase subunit PurS [Kofleriaceae bacterium]|nr:phosphoribosylformylglycinamidine synthase subunit PurS [Kofleriaceae bacterium]